MQWNRQKFIIVILLTTLVATSGCQARKLSRRLMPTPLGIAIGLPHPGGNFVEACNCTKHEVPVFVVSGRELKPERLRSGRQLPDPFGGERSQMPTLGVAYVTIGKGLTPEELHQQTVTPVLRKEARVAFSRIELSSEHESDELFHEHETPRRHSSNSWIDAIKRQLDNDPNRNITVFVHGYNTELVDNTLVSAEIYHYLGHRGAMISFEWPSKAKLLQYIQDKGNANFSTRHFRVMLSNLARECSANSVTIIAHSAGSPIVVNALRELRLIDDQLSTDQLHQKYKVDRVVLAAPDMDLMAFINAVRDGFQDVPQQVAVYASAKDRALRFSERLYGNLRLGRAVNDIEGWEKDILMDADGIELIDASVAEENYKTFLRHNYFHRDPWISSDIGSFILRRPPEQRNLEKSPGEVFWRFPTDYPDQLRQRAKALQPKVQLNLSG